MAGDNTVAKQVMSMSPRLIAALAQSATEIAKAISELLKGYEEYSFIKDIKKHADEDKDLDFTLCKGILYGKLDKKLNEKGIPHVMMQDTKTGMIICVTKDTDRDALIDAKNEILQEERRISRVSPKEFYRMHANKEVHTISDVTDVQLKLFQEEARKAGFVMCAQKEENGLYKISYAYPKFPSDPEKREALKKSIDTAFDRVVMATSGILGEEDSKKIQINIDNIKNIGQKLNDNAEFYVVSSANIDEYIHINEREFEHIRNDRQIRCEQKIEENFSLNLYNQTMGLVRPIVFESAELEAFRAHVNRIAEEYEVDVKHAGSRIMQTINSQYDGKVKDYMSDAQRGRVEYSTKSTGDNTVLTVKPEDPKRTLTREQERLAKREMDLRRLVGMKMSLDNGLQSKISSSFFNGEVSFSEFFTIEQVNDIYDETQKNEYEALIKKFDNASPEVQKHAREVVKEIYTEINGHDYFTEFVDRERLSQDDLDSVIDSKDDFTMPDDSRD